MCDYSYTLLTLLCNVIARQAASKCVRRCENEQLRAVQSSQRCDAAAARSLQYVDYCCRSVTVQA
jgi:hypothetical protein